ncbi:MAG: peptide deformylase, partial [Eggerthellaceae bacterium]
NPIVLVNPVLVDTQGDPVVAGEGCLSCPGISVPIARPPFARVRYFDLDGEEWEIEGDDLLGRCLQHELDHLDGITMYERCDPMARIEALRDYEIALAAGSPPGRPRSKRGCANHARRVHGHARVRDHPRRFGGAA